MIKFLKINRVSQYHSFSFEVDGREFDLGSYQQEGGKPSVRIKEWVKYTTPGGEHRTEHVERQRIEGLEVLTKYDAERLLCDYLETENK